jgi:hypothetical protein
MSTIAAAYDNGTVQANTIGLAFGRIKRDLSYLEITDADYSLAASELLAANEAFWKREEGKVGTRKMTPEEIALEEERGRLAHVVFLRIDTLYFVGHRLLDGIVAAADTVLTPIRGLPRGQKNLGRHRKVKARLEERMKAGSAPPASDALFSLIDEVTKRVKDYRDDYVVHAAPPTFPERRPRVRIGQERHELITEGDPRSEVADGVTNLLIRYVNAWLDYLETVPLPFEWSTPSD